MYGTTTRLRLKGERDLHAAIRALEQLVSEARSIAGFRECYVLHTEVHELTMVTIYASEEDANAVMGQLRPKLTEKIGPHIAAPPERAAGNVVVPPL